MVLSDEERKANRRKCDAEASHSTSEVSVDGTTNTYYYCRDHNDP